MCSDSIANDTQKGGTGVIGMKFPAISAESLAGTKVTIPDSAKGLVTLVTIAFKRESQSQLDSWLEPFAGAFGGKPGFTFYEVPMIKTYYKLMALVIDGGMRAGIPREKHKNVMTYYGDTEKYQKILFLDDQYKGYAFLLDRDGIIRWKEEGFASKEKINDMIEATQRLGQGK